MFRGVGIKFPVAGGHAAIDTPAVDVVMTRVQLGVWDDHVL